MQTIDVIKTIQRIEDIVSEEMIYLLFSTDFSEDKSLPSPKVIKAIVDLGIIKRELKKNPQSEKILTVFSLDKLLISAESSKNYFQTSRSQNG